MFERYTEEARRTIFYARYEAAAAGSPEIESEHMLLALLRAHPPLAAGIPDGANLDAVRKELIPAPRPTTSTSVDLPLSHAMKRVLAYAAEDSERLGHWHIGPEHLVLGLLKESDSGAARYLGKHGLDRATLWKQTAGAPPDSAPAYSRQMLHEWIDRMSDDSLQRAGRILRYELEMSGAPGRFGRGRGGALHQWSRQHDPGGTAVVSRHVFEGHTVIIREQFGLSEDGRTLSVTVEIEREGRRHRQTVEFDAAAGGTTPDG